MNRKNINNGVNFGKTIVGKKILFLMASLFISEGAKQNSNKISSIGSRVFALDKVDSKTKKDLKNVTVKDSSDEKLAAENVNIFSELPFAGVDFTDLFSGFGNASSLNKTTANKSSANKSSANKSSDIKVDNAGYNALNSVNNDGFTQILKQRMAERVADDEKLAKALMSAVSESNRLSNHVTDVADTSSSSTNKIEASVNNGSGTNKNNSLADQSILDSLDMLLSKNTDSFKSIVEAKSNREGTFDFACMDKNALHPMGFDNLSSDTLFLLVIMADEFMAALQEYLMISMWTSFADMMFTPEFASDYGLNYDSLISASNAKTEELKMNSLFASGFDIDSALYTNNMNSKFIQGLQTANEIRSLEELPLFKRFVANGNTANNNSNKAQKFEIFASSGDSDVIYTNAADSSYIKNLKKLDPAITTADLSESPFFGMFA